MKRSLLRLLVPGRVEIEDKWWNRLFIVVLVATSILLAGTIFFSVLFEIKGEWRTTNVVAFSLEPHYESARGVELNCDSVLDSFGATGQGNQFIMKCDGISLDRKEAKRYAALYIQARESYREEKGLNTYLEACKEMQRTPEGRMSQTQIDCIRNGMAAQEADPNYAEYEQYSGNLGKVKVLEEKHWPVILSDVLKSFISAALTMLAWVIFWSSIVYRTVLYIIFGRQKRS